jgi:DNA adenine methylase
MRYMGGKQRIAKQLLSVMLKYRPLDSQLWVEPFVGGGGMIRNVTGNRLGADINPYVIKALEYVRDTPLDKIPYWITEHEYEVMRKNKKLDGLTSYVGSSLSFGGKGFDVYARRVRGSKNNIDEGLKNSIRAKISAAKLKKDIKGVKLLCCAYDELDIPSKSIVYCDPPYKGTTGYGFDFDHDKFWKWVERVSKTNRVFVSEYSAPKKFKSLIDIPSFVCLNANAPPIQHTEKLFTI